MNKPERVDVGQWWLWPDWPTPIRIEDIDTRGNHPRAIHSNGHGDTAFAYLMLYGTYLGNGENPEPSEWMVETLGRHAYETNGGIVGEWPDDPMGHSIRASYRLRALNAIRSISDRGDTLHRSVRSLYRILRSLGKW